MRSAIGAVKGGPVLVEEVTPQPLGDNDVRVRTDAAGVCHTDLSMLRGANGRTYPFVLGHEGAGTILEVGRSVTRCRPGDRVITSWSAQCGSCYHCARHEGVHCTASDPIKAQRFVARADGTRMPLQSGIGTFSEEMVIHEYSVVPVEADLPPEQLALIGCGVATGAGAALWTAEVKPGATVAVFGLGGVGLSVLQGAKIAGAQRIIAVDPIAAKRELALSLGATDVVDPKEHDPVEQLRELTSGRGVDFAFEVTGIPSVMSQCLASVRRRGTAVAMGMPLGDEAVPVPITALFSTERRLIGSLYGSVQIHEHFPLLVRFAESGLLDLAPLVSRTIGLDEVNDAFRWLEEGSVIRSVITPGSK